MIEVLIALLLVFAAGYELGKRKGWETGFLEAEALTPLRLRQESLESERCSLCRSELSAASDCRQLMETPD